MSLRFLSLFAMGRGLVLAFALVPSGLPTAPARLPSRFLATALSAWMQASPGTPAVLNANGGCSLMKALPSGSWRLGAFQTQPDLRGHSSNGTDDSIQPLSNNPGRTGSRQVD